MDLADGVAVRISALCLDRKGRVADWLICSHAVRAGLLLDLALAGRIVQTADSIVVDSTPTGFPPADQLLAAVNAEPDRTLDHWLAARGIGLRDLVAANEASGRWQRRRLRFRRDRFRNRHQAQTDADLARPAQGPTDGWTRGDACVTAVAAASGLLGPALEFPTMSGSPAEPSPAVIAATGPVAWLCQTAVDHLYATAMKYRTQASALRVGDMPGPP